jgi:hypothetical protein
MTKAETARSSRTPFRNVYIWLALLIPATLLAFAKSYFTGVTFSGKPVTTIIHVHAALMMLWILMLIGQAWFIRAGRYRLHRWVGRSSFIIAPLIIVTLLAMDHEFLREAPELAMMDARLMIYDFGQLAGFGLAWALGLAYRRRTPLHVRFMVSTVFAMGSAIMFRIILNWFAWVPGIGTENIENAAAANGTVLVLMLLALIVNDWRYGIKRSPFWLVTVTTAIIHVGFFTFTKTDWWMSLLQWFADLSW